MAKQWVLGNIKDLDKLKYVVNQFHEFLERGKSTTKDIYQIKNFKDLESEVDHLNKSGKGISKKELESDYEIVKDDKDLIVAVPHSHEASRKLGMTTFAYRDCGDGTKDSNWCVTYKASDHFHGYYHSRGGTLYFIKAKSEQLINALKDAFPKRGAAMIVVAILLKSEENKHIGYKGIIEGFDGDDNLITGGELKRYLRIIGMAEGSNGMMKFFKPKYPLLIPRRSKEERFKKIAKANAPEIERIIKEYYDKFGGKGTLSFNSLPVAALPDNLVIGEDLNLLNTGLEELPKNLKIGRDLIASSTNIKTIPDDLEVGRHIYLPGTPITTIPDSLKIINGDLILYESKVQSIPKNIQIKRDLHIRNTPLSKKYSKDELRSMFPGVKGDIITK